MMTSSAKRLASEADIRAMSHEQLLEYTIQNISAPNSSTNSNMHIDGEPGSHSDMHQLPENIEQQHNLVDSELPDSSEVAQVIKRGRRESTKENDKKKKRKKEFDMSRYGQRMVALKLNYQGWRFHGFASQTTSDNTVEAHLFKALLRTRLIESRGSCDYSRAGRTDVGVSALNQVVGIRIRSAIVPPSKGSHELDYVKTINSALPDGMRITAWSPVCDGTNSTPQLYDGDSSHLKQYWESISRSRTEKIDGDISNDAMNDRVVRRPGEKFSARFDATSRSYKYFFARSTLNLKAMSEAAAMFEGRHDFGNFCRFDDSVTNFERLMYNVEIRCVSENADIGDRKVCENECLGNEYKMYYIYVKGQAFLWHQVRCMAAVLFDVGRGLEEPKVVFDMLNDVKVGSGSFANGRPHYKLASPTPLLLFDCDYPSSVVWFGEQEQSKSLEKADRHIAESWTNEASKCAIVAEILKDNDKMFGSFERKSERQLFINGSNGDQRRHIPYRLRGRDDPISAKVHRAKMKKDERELTVAKALTSASAPKAVAE